MFIPLCNNLRRSGREKNPTQIKEVEKDCPRLKIRKVVEATGDM